MCCVRGFLSVIPILIAILAGYAAALAVGVVTTADVMGALTQNFLQQPHFQMAKFKPEAIMVLLPVILVIASEHIGHQIVTGQIIGRDR